MNATVTALWNDEAGFVVSAELILISTIAVLSLIVGLTEISFGVNQELEDVGSAVGSMNQSFFYSGVTGFKGVAVGSVFGDDFDQCDGEFDISCESGARREGTRDDYNY